MTDLIMGKRSLDEFENKSREDEEDDQPAEPMVSQLRGLN